MTVKKCKVIETNLGKQVMVYIIDKWWGYKLVVQLVGDSNMYSTSINGDIHLLTSAFDRFDNDSAAMFVHRMKTNQYFTKNDKQ